MSHGDVVELVVTGTLLDGTEFEAYDCISIAGRNPARLLRGFAAPPGQVPH
jgi:hypothetical protein